MRHSIRTGSPNAPPLVWLLAALASALCGEASAANESPPRPNILVLLTDNQPWWAMKCAGNTIIHTPGMDRLAADGLRFTNAFVTTPVCAASRASIFTGLYRRRHGYTFLAPPLRREFAERSYPALLRAAGYCTGLIGKFGIESNGRLRLENEKATLAKMFDHFDNFEHWGVAGPRGYFVEQADGGTKHLTDVTADKAIRFLREHAKRGPGRPFCLSVSFNAPHAQDDDPRQYFWPHRLDGLYRKATIPPPQNSAPAFFAAQPKFLQNSLGRERWRWRFDTPEKFQQMMKGMYRMVTGVDEAIGRIRTGLADLGLERNTMIIFTSDNGMFFGDRGLSDCWLLYENSIRVPLIVFDPRMPKAVRGTTRDELALNIDIAPTILDAAGRDLPGVLQGRTLMPLCRAQKEVDWRSDFLCEHLFNHPEIPKSEGVRTQRWKYICYFEQRPAYEELYDLVRDPHETHNLAGDARYSRRLKQLRRRRDELVNAAAPAPPP